MNESYERWTMLQERIARACQAADREIQSVKLLAVGKQHPAEAIARLHALGQARFGENRVEEALKKQEALTSLAIEWHFIGAIQSRKTREIAEHFDWVQSVDREKVLQRLSKQRPPNQKPLNICLQVNIDREPQKAGLMSTQLEAMADLASKLPGIKLRGLMCIPSAGVSSEQTGNSFSQMRKLYGALRAQGHPLDTLSMGMSGDLELAIAEGSTMLRVGTDLFGPRPER